MLTVHHLENSRSHRIVWILEELGVDYEIAHYERDPQTMLAPRKLRDLHFLGKAPILTDGDDAIAESGAIIEYLIDNYDDGALRPESGTPAYDQYRYWMHYAEGSAMKPLLLKTVFAELPRQGPWLAKPILKTISKTFDRQYLDGEMSLHMKFWEGELQQRPYFAGDEFSAADVQMSIPLESVIAQGASRQEFPRIHEMVENYRERPAYERAVERGGELNL